MSGFDLEKRYGSIEEIKRDLFPNLDEAERIADEVEPICAETEAVIATAHARRTVKSSGTAPSPPRQEGKP